MIVLTCLLKIIMCDATFDHGPFSFGVFRFRLKIEANIYIFNGK